MEASEFMHGLEKVVLKIFLPLLQYQSYVLLMKLWAVGLRQARKYALK